MERRYNRGGPQRRWKFDVCGKRGASGSQSGTRVFNSKGPNVSEQWAATTLHTTHPHQAARIATQLLVVQRPLAPPFPHGLYHKPHDQVRFKPVTIVACSIELEAIG
jgi:hypothetical protein